MCIYIYIYVYIYTYINSISWFKLYCVADCVVLRPWRLLPFILIDIQFGVSCYGQHVLLYLISVLGLYNFPLWSYFRFACCTLANFIYIHTYINITLYRHIYMCIYNFVVYVFLLFVHVILSLSMYSYCCLSILIVVYVFFLLSMYSYCCLCIVIVRPCILIVVYVFLLLFMYS